MPHLSAMEFIRQDAASKQNQDKEVAYEQEKEATSDLEAGKIPATTTTERRTSTVEEIRHGSVAEIARTKEIQHKITVFSTLRKGEEWLDDKMGIELQGIDRVPEDERKPPSMWNIFWLWWSLNVHVGVIPLGVVGAEFGLDLKQIVGAGIVGNVLGALCTAWCGTMSPKVGLVPLSASAQLSTDSVMLAWPSSDRRLTIQLRLLGRKALLSAEYHSRRRLLCCQSGRGRSDTCCGL